MVESRPVQLIADLLSYSSVFFNMIGGLSVPCDICCMETMTSWDVVCILKII